MIKYLGGDLYLNSMVRRYNISNVGKYILEYISSKFSINGYQETTQESNCTKEIMSEINYIVESPEGIFYITLKLINQ